MTVCFDSGRCPHTSDVLGYNIHMLEYKKAIYSFQMCLLQQLLFNVFVKQHKSAFPIIRVHGNNV